MCKPAHELGKTKARKKQTSSPVRKPRIKALISYIDNATFEITTTKKRKHRLIRMQRYKKPLKVTDIDLTKNPNKLSFLILHNKYGDRLEMFSYKNNPEKAFISLNGQVIGANHFKWRELQSGITKMGKYLGVLK